jgi:hypothetical protein
LVKWLFSEKACCPEVRSGNAADGPWFVFGVRQVLFYFPSLPIAIPGWIFFHPKSEVRPDELHDNFHPGIALEGGTDYLPNQAGS